MIELLLTFTGPLGRGYGPPWATPMQLRSRSRLCVCEFTRPRQAPQKCLSWPRKRYYAMHRDRMSCAIFLIFSFGLPLVAALIVAFAKYLLMHAIPRID